MAMSIEEGKRRVNSTEFTKRLEIWALLCTPIVKADITYDLREYLNPWPIHYVIQDDNLLADGYIDEDMQVIDFLRNTYSGNAIPCKLADGGYGLYYTMREEDFDVFTSKAVKKMITKKIELDLKVKEKDAENICKSNFLTLGRVCGIQNVYSCISVIQFYEMDTDPIKKYRK